MLQNHDHLTKTMFMYILLYETELTCICVPRAFREQSDLSDLCVDPMSGDCGVCNTDDLGSCWNCCLGRRSECNTSVKPLRSVPLVFLLYMLILSLI